MNKQQEILSLLTKIETSNDVTILLAVETGSRAWGFASKDSDYDVRFIYCHPAHWYLSPFEKRDVIDTVFIGDLDAGGWDIGKSLRLLKKGNGPLFEWLYSPIVYRQDTSKVVLLKELAAQSFNAKAVFYHYLSMAKKKLEDDKVWNNAKSCLYALRSLLCAQWIVDENTNPPVPFQYLKDRYFQGHSISLLIDQLLVEKQHLTESAKVNINPEIQDYMLSCYDAIKNRAEQVPVGDAVKLSAYDEVFRKVID